MTDAPAIDSWPALDWQQWQATADTLHMFTQIVGRPPGTCSAAKPLVECTPVRDRTRVIDFRNALARRRPA